MELIYAHVIGNKVQKNREFPDGEGNSCRQTQLLGSVSSRHNITNMRLLIYSDAFT